MTLEEATAQFFASLQSEKDGTTCPCCKRYGKVYPRHIDSSMARTLIWLYWECKSRNWNWVNIPKEAPRFVIDSREHGRLKHWGLAYDKPNMDDPTKKDSGLHRISQNGCMFVLGQIQVPKTVYMWDNTVVYESEQLVSITDCLGEKFNYQDMMQEEIPGAPMPPSVQTDFEFV